MSAALPLKNNTALSARMCFTRFRDLFGSRGDPDMHDFLVSRTSGYVSPWTQLLLTEPLLCGQWPTAELDERGRNVWRQAIKVNVLAFAVSDMDIAC